MNRKLFEAILQESGKVRIKSEEQIKRLLDVDGLIEARHTGPFGEDINAVVIGYGKVKDFYNELSGIKEAALEEGYDNVEDWLADNEETSVIVLDRTVGQSGYNWYDLDSYSVEDLDLWADSDDIKRANRRKNTVTRVQMQPTKHRDKCPNCGGTDFEYDEIFGEYYDMCKKCRTLYPIKS